VRSGTHSFQGLPVGNYEVRLYYNWPSGKHNVQDRLSLRVGVSTETHPQKLKLDKNMFAPNAQIKVYFEAPSTFADNAWVGIIPSHVQHGSESVNDQHDLSYQYLKRRTSGTLIFRTPAQFGSYDFRMHDTDDNGREVASVSFKVGVSVTGQRPFPSAPEIPVQAGCRTLAQVYTDGSGDRRTKKLGGNYAAIRLDSLRDDQTIRVEAVSGRLTYVTLHARYQGGHWRTIYKGPKTEFPVGQYIAPYKKDRNCTHVNVSVNGAHEKYDPVACKANLLVCGAPDKPGRVLTPPELPTGGTVTTGELRNIQKKLIVLNHLFWEAYQNYQNYLKHYGPSEGGYSVDQAFARYKRFHKMYKQAQQEYIQSNQERYDVYGKVITKKMKKDVLSQLVNEAYQHYQDSLRVRGINHPVTQGALDQYRWLLRYRTFLPR
jgi:hypothetical protein